MKTLLTIILLSVTMLSSTANAKGCNINTPELSKEANQKLILACETAKLAAIESESASVAVVMAKDAGSVVAESLSAENVSKWGGVVRDITRELVAAAAGLGIAVNDFLTSPAGVLIALVIVVNVIGAELFSFLIGVPLFIFFCYMYKYALDKIFIKEIVYSPKSGWFGRQEKTHIKHTDQEQRNEGILKLSVFTIIILLIIAFVV